MPQTDVTHAATGSLARLIVVAFQMTVRDLLDEFGDVTTYDTPTFRDRTERQFGGRAAYVGLTWTFGSGPRRQQEPQFDFGSAPTGG